MDEMLMEVRKTLEGALGMLKLREKANHSMYDRNLELVEEVKSLKKN